MKARKIILATDKPYADEYESLLRDLYHRRIELFCAWGAHCEQWELAMELFVPDPVWVGPGRHRITAISHVDAGFDEVMDLARNWQVSHGSDAVETIRL